MDESVPEIAGDEMGGVVRSWRAEVGMDEDEDAGCLLMIHDMRLKSFEMAKEAGARAITVTNTIRGMIAITRCIFTFCRCSHPRIAYAPNITSAPPPRPLSRSSDFDLSLLLSLLPSP